MQKRTKWILLNAPAGVMFFLLLADPSLWKAFTPYSGYTAMGLLVLTLSLNPLQYLFPRFTFLKKINHHRRILGVACFSYAALHVLCFIIKRGSLAATFKFLLHPALLPSALAFVFFLALALTSNNFSVKKMGFLNWKKLHKTVYIAEVLIFIHMWFLSPLVGFLVFIPLVTLQLIRRRGKRNQSVR